VNFATDYDTIGLGNHNGSSKELKFIEAGVMRMAGIVAGLLVCAFVYVIRESLFSPEEEM
jgi:hypothetical protein